VKKKCIIWYKLHGMRVQSLLTVLCFLCISAQAQVLQPLGSGLPARVVASYASGNEYLALFEETSTAELNDFTMARWNGVSWSYYPGLTTPLPVKTVKGTYNFHSIALYHDTMYAAAYMANAERDADVPVSHLYKWDGLKWVAEIGVVDTRNNGIIAMTVFDDKLIVAGLFDNTVNGNPVQNIAAYNGKSWSYLGNSGTAQGTDGVIRTLAVVGNRLYIGGDFQTFAGSSTGNIAYYTAANGGWGGVGSPFKGEVLELGVFNNKIAALGKNASGDKQISIFQGTWGSPIGFDSFSVSSPTTLMGAGTDLLIGGSFVKNGNGTSLLVYDGTSLRFTGNRINGSFNLGQRGDGAFIWGDFTELNTDLQYFSKIESESGNLYGDLFYDVNSNCVKDDAEIGLSNQLVRMVNKVSGTVYFAVTDSSGHFTMAMPAGDYDLSTNPGKHLYGVCLGNNTARIRKGVYSYVSLGYYQLPSIVDVQLGMNAIIPAGAKAGDEVKVIVKIANHGGTALTNGTIHIQHGPEITNFQSEPMPDNYANNEAVYSVSNLPAFGEQIIVINTAIPLTAQPADDFKFMVKSGTGLTLKDADTKDNNDTVKLSLSRRGGMVTVQKSNIEEGAVDYRQKQWEYRVDFRNVSGTMVKRVVMVDTLDANLPLSRLVLTSFYPNKANYCIEQGRVLVVDFPEANLSSFEANPISSVGYVMYRVETYQTLPLKTVINNIATVDYDSKWQATSKNCAVTLVDKTASVKMIKGGFNLYPNPSFNQLNVSGLSAFRNCNWQLVSMTGVTVLNGQVNADSLSISVKDIATGVYTLRIGNATSLVQIQH